MDLRDLVRAALGGDVLGARQWVADASRAKLRWGDVPRPEGLDESELAVAAALADMLAERAGQAPPGWTSSVGPARQTTYLVKEAEHLGRMRARLELETPEPLRRRGVRAPANFLTIA
jgi:hypothetical protein